MSTYHDGSRRLQDRFDTRRLADRLADVKVRDYGLLESALTLKVCWPAMLPTDWKTAPRGEVALKKLNGRLFGSAELSGTPSQFISRLPDVKD